MRRFEALMAVAAVLAVAACKETTKIESKEPAAAATQPADKGPGVEIRTNNDTIKADSSGVSATIKTDN